MLVRAFVTLPSEFLSAQQAQHAASTALTVVESEFGAEGSDFLVSIVPDPLTTEIEVRFVADLTLREVIARLPLIDIDADLGFDGVAVTDEWDT